MTDPIDDGIRRILDEAAEEKRAVLAAITADIIAGVDADARTATHDSGKTCPGCGGDLDLVPFEVTSLRDGPPAVWVHADDYTLPCPITTKE